MTGLVARVPALEGGLGHEPGRIRERAQQLLSEPPYAQESPDLLTRVAQTLRRWLAEGLEAVLELLAGTPTRAWLVVLLGTALLLLVVWRTTRGMTVDRAVDGTVPAQGRRPAVDWHAEADAHERAGDWEQAVRCRYVALVTDLVERGIVEEVPGRTVGELDRELATAAPGLADDVAEAGRRFAEVAYGRAPARREQARELAALADRVAGRAGRGRAPAGVGEA